MGTSVDKHVVILVQQDHPHAYGDKVTIFSMKLDTPGSSPRVWGQVCKKLNITVENRIIPTRMGTSAYRRLPRYCQRDHPHAYGDKQRAIRG